MDDKILIVEDELIVAKDVRRSLERSGYKIMGIARTTNEALGLIAGERPFIVLLDIYLEEKLTGIDLAIELNKQNIPFIYLSANSNKKILEQANFTEPYGFIVKPFREKDVLVGLEIAKYRIEQKRQLRDQQTPPVQSTIVSNKFLPQTGTVVENGISFEGIVGNSPKMQYVFDLITQVAPLATSVLILGENGTGKEGVANCIHRLSTRNNKPFVKINCAALPLNLVESELFGHERGSFTGANERKIGKFEQASGGTILLDEIGEMSAEVQVKLLRVLQEKEIDRIGGKSSIKVDVRIIAATNKDLELEVAQGRFRMDLYYRLLVFPITIPPLRERVEDIPALTDHFLNAYSLKNNIPLKTISKMALAELQRHTWPGNVRELEYLLERTILLTKGKEIETVTIPGRVDNASNNMAFEGSTKTMQEMEGEHILAVLKQTNNRIAGKGGAAELLNLPPSTLYSKMKKLGIIRKFPL